MSANDTSRALIIRSSRALTIHEPAASLPPAASTFTALPLVMVVAAALSTYYVASPFLASFVQAGVQAAADVAVKPIVPVARPPEPVAPLSTVPSAPTVAEIVPAPPAALAPPVVSAPKIVIVPATTPAPQPVELPAAAPAPVVIERPAVVPAAPREPVIVEREDAPQRPVMRGFARQPRMFAPMMRSPFPMRGFGGFFNQRAFGFARPFSVFGMFRH